MQHPALLATRGVECAERGWERAGQGRVWVVKPVAVVVVMVLCRGAALRPPSATAHVAIAHIVDPAGQVYNIHLCGRYGDARGLPPRVEPRTRKHSLGEA